jgi:CheY-like chemotaxis protein
MLKIFILDDDRINNDLNEIMLNSMGINDIDIRTTAKEALDYLVECSRSDVFPLIMFVDLNLPGMNGFDFIGHFEKHYRDKYPYVRIVMLTNSILQEDRIRALQYESVLDFLSKPLTTGKMKELLDRVHVSA